MPNEKINGYNIAKPLVLAYYDKTYATLPSIDAKYGPYDSIEDCLRIIDSPLRAEGLTVAIKNSENKYDEYWFVGGIADSNLELKIKNGRASKLEVIIVDFLELQKKVDELSDKLTEFNPTGVELSEGQKRAIIERIMEAINTDNAVNAQTLVDEIQNTTKSYIEQLIREGRLTSGSDGTTTSGVTESKVTDLITKYVTKYVRTKIVTAETVADAINVLSEKANSDDTKIKATKGLIKSITDIVSTDNVSYRAEVEAFITALYEKMKSKLPSGTSSTGGSTTSATIDNTSFLNAFKDASFATNVLPYLISALSTDSSLRTKLVELVSNILDKTGVNDWKDDGILSFITRITNISSDDGEAIYDDLAEQLNKLFANHYGSLISTWAKHDGIKIIVGTTRQPYEVNELQKILNSDSTSTSYSTFGISKTTPLIIKINVGEATGSGTEEIVPTISFITHKQSLTIDFKDPDSNGLSIEYSEYNTGTKSQYNTKKYSFSWSNILEGLGGSTTTVASNGTKVYATNNIRGINETVNGIVFDFNSLVKFTSSSKFVIQGTLRLKDTDKGDGVAPFNFYWDSDYTSIPVFVAWKNDRGSSVDFEVIEIYQSALPGKLTLQLPYDPEVMIIQGVTVTEITT